VPWCAADDETGVEEAEEIIESGWDADVIVLRLTAGVVVSWIASIGLILLLLVRSHYQALMLQPLSSSGDMYLLFV